MDRGIAIIIIFYSSLYITLLILLSIYKIHSLLDKAFKFKFF